MVVTAEIKKTLKKTTENIDSLKKFMNSSCFFNKNNSEKYEFLK